MKKICSFFLFLSIAFTTVSAQTPGTSQQQTSEQDDIVRITTALVQTDVVVTDKSEQPISDLKIEDFEVYENGKKQELKFLEFVSVDSGRRLEFQRPAVAALPPGAEVPRELSAVDLKRVVAFVVDDLTIPFADMATVRQILRDFVDNQMKEGDLVAIVRVVGGKGLLQQFTSDKQLLKRAIAALNVVTNPYSAVDNSALDRIEGNPAGSRGVDSEDGEAASAETSAVEQGLGNLNDPNEETTRLFRGLMSLTTAGFVIDSLKEIPGRKSLVLISGGIPIFEANSTGTAYSNVSYLLNRLSDQAVRAGVVVNTMDPRGLKATPGVASFTATPARSALGGENPSFGRGGGTDQIFGPPLAGALEHLGLNTVSDATGGVSVVNTNNFKGGLDRVLARSAAYYLLAYSPVDKFDNKFRRIEIKVKRKGVKVYSHRGYMARADRASDVPRTKEEEILAAVKSPLAKRELDVSANINIKLSPVRNTSTIDIHLALDANKLKFTQTPDGKYQTSFDVVGVVYDQLGRVRGGFSETVNINFTAEKYKEALKTGLTYSASTEVPPGYFQVRAAVREEGSGSLGSIFRYLEIPDLTKGRLAMSSVFLFTANTVQSKEAPLPLLAVRQISRKQDLRYAALIYNAKASNGKTQLRSQVIISQGPNILYKEPEQMVEVPPNSQATRIGQIGLSKVSPGRYTLTVVVTDLLADKKTQTVARSVDFTVVN